MSSGKPERTSPAIRPGRLLLAVLVWVSMGTTAAQAAPHAPPHGAPPPVDLKLPPDIVYDRVVRADSAVVFSHWSHVDYESYRCTGCHPKLFHMLNTTRRASHREMNHGGSCGACHDGKHAFDVRDTESCSSCHAGRSRAGTAAGDSTAGHARGSFKGPGPFSFKPGSDSPGLVTFRHATHLGKQLVCRSCHPKPFPMKGVGALSPAGMHDPGACGMCHDGKKSFSVEDDTKCDRCHVEGKGVR